MVGAITPTVGIVGIVAAHAAAIDERREFENAPRLAIERLVPAIVLDFNAEAT